MVNGRTGACKGPEAGRVRKTQNRGEHRRRWGELWSLGCQGSWDRRVGD